MPIIQRSFHRNILRATIVAAVAVFTFATAAYASVIISNAPTSGVSCTSNYCQQTNRGHAVLNVTQLETLLASSGVTVATNTEYITVNSEITWASAHELELDGAVIVNRPIVVTGSGGLYLLSMQLGPKGTLTFWSTSSSLEIGDGQSITTYTLVNSIATLASAVAANPTGNFAFAEDYKATADGIYRSSPVSSFSGKLLGLNHTISQLTIADGGEGHQVGLFGTLSGSVSLLNLKNVHIAGAKNSQVGGIAGVNNGSLSNDFVDGVISTGHGTSRDVPGAIAGGLVGLNNSSVQASSSTGHVSGDRNAMVGGAVGENYNGELGYVFSTAAVSLDSDACAWCGRGGPPDSAGGLVGANFGGIYSCYATGAVSGEKSAKLGGLVGTQFGTSTYHSFSESYSTGAVSGRGGSSIGGLIGFDNGSVALFFDYWDLSKSVPYPTLGAGNISDDPGVTGLTTSQLQSGLPPAFDAGTWGESPTINGGLPYLLSNPPK